MADVRENARSIEQGRVRLGKHMFEFIDRYPTAALWIIAAGNALVMLGVNVLLRALVQ